jgi:hypothetical protein
MSLLSNEELNILRHLVQAARTEIGGASATTLTSGLPVGDDATQVLERLDRKLYIESLKEPGEPDLWVSEQHGSLVSIRGYEAPDTSVYKNWRKAQFIAD